MKKDGNNMNHPDKTETELKKMKKAKSDLIA